MNNVRVDQSFSSFLDLNSDEEPSEEADPLSELDPLNPVISDTSNQIENEDENNPDNANKVDESEQTFHPHILKRRLIHTYPPENDNVVNRVDLEAISSNDGSLYTSAISSLED